MAEKTSRMVATKQAEHIRQFVTKLQKNENCTHACTSIKINQIKMPAGMVFTGSYVQLKILETWKLDHLKFKLDRKNV